MLILGGTTEAMELAALMDGDPRFAPIMSLAGRTSRPRLARITNRIGGFGGVDGLKRYLAESGVRAVVDATHPFAAQISHNAMRACTESGVAHTVLTRPKWEKAPGDNWIEVDSFAAARNALGAVPRTVFLTIGRQEVSAFDGPIPHRYIVRSVDAVDAGMLPDGARTLMARGPFVVEQEMALMSREGVNVVVSKNSGGATTYAKIEAARLLGIQVVMIKRPRQDEAGDLHDAASVIAWLDAVRTHDGSS